MIITAPNPASSDTDTIVSVFFPSVNLSALRHVMRLDGTVTPERLRHAVNGAISIVNHNLQKWAAQLVNLTGQPVTGLDAGQTETYLRAVYAYTAANLTERMTSFDATQEGLRRAEELNGYAHQLMRDGHWAIRDLQGLPRTTVALI